MTKLSTATLIAALLTGHYSAAQETMPESTVDKMIFDVFIAGKQQGTALVTYNNQWAQLDNVHDVLDQLTGIHTPEAFTQLLQGKLNLQGTRIEDGVGEVRVDADNFAIYLNVDKQQAALKKLSPAGHIQADDTWALQNIVQVHSSHDSANEGDPYSFTHITSLADGPWRTTFNGTVTDKESYDFDTAVVEHDRNSARYRFGLLNTQGTDFIGSTPYYGVQIQDNYRQLTSLENFQATPVEIYVPTRSRVRVFKDGNTLIFNETLDFGLQQIPTSAFPSGSYALTIQIEEPDGNVIEENRSFHKDGALSAFDHPSFNLQLGILRDDLNVERGFVLQGDYAWRFTDVLESELSFYGNNEFLTFEPKLKLSLGDYYATTALSFTSDSDIAAKARLQYRPQGSALQWNISASKTLQGHEEQTGATAYDDLSRLKSREHTNLSGSASYRYKDVTFGFSGSSNTYGSNPTTYAFGPRATWSAYTTTEHRTQVEARITHTNDHNDASIIASYRYTPQKEKWQYQGKVGRSNTATDQFTSTEHQISYSGRNSDENGLNASLSHNYLGNKTHDINTTLADLSYKTGAYTLDTELEQRHNSEDGDSNRMDISFASNMIITKNGVTNLDKGAGETAEKTRITFASKEQLGSAVILDIVGNAQGTPVNVMVNNRIAAKTEVGERVTVTIPEYQRTTVTLAPAEDAGLLHMTNNSLEITLHPNNVYHKEWTVNTMTLATGRLIDVHGKPLAWQRIRGLNHTATTDANGFIQMELVGNETPYVQNNNTSCTLAVPRIHTNNMLNNLGDIVCG